MVGAAGRPMRTAARRRSARPIAIAGTLLVGLALGLVACSGPNSGRLPTAVTDASAAVEGSFPPDLSLAPDDSDVPVDSGGPEDSGAPDESLGPDDSNLPDGSFTHGSATITFSNGSPSTVQLPHLAADMPSSYEPDFGVSIAWRGGDWAIHLDGGDPTDQTGFGLVITREDTDPPLLADGSTCTLTFSTETATHVVGKATCSGLVWIDAFGDDTSDLPSPAAATPSSSLPPFDATITFEATP